MTDRHRRPDRRRTTKSQNKLTNSDLLFTVYRALWRSSILPCIYLETDNNDTSVTTPEIAQLDADRIHEATNNSVFIPEGNNSRSAGVTILVDETPLGGGDHIDVSQDFLPPKIQELDPPTIEVEDVSNEDSDNEEPIGSYVNSEGLVRSHRDRHQPIYPIVTGQPGGYYDESNLGQYTQFLEEGFINMNPGDAKDYKISCEEVNYHIIGVVLA